MFEDENYTDIDIIKTEIFDPEEDGEQHAINSEQSNLGTSVSENQTSTPETDLLNSDATPSVINTNNSASINEVNRTTASATSKLRMPMSRIKNIMKFDPDVSVISGDAVFLVTKATELFLETIAKETYSYTVTNKRKTISKKDLDLIINKVDCLCFLEGAMDF